MGASWLVPRIPSVLYRIRSQVHQLAEQLQVLDVLLFKFVLLADKQTKALGLNGKGRSPCGYVSSGAHIQA